MTPQNLRYDPDMFEASQQIARFEPPAADSFFKRLYKFVTNVFSKTFDSEKPAEIKVGLDSIKYGKKKIGCVEYDLRMHSYGDSKKYPEDWFVEGQLPNEDGQRLVKPYMWIDLLCMDDRRGPEMMLVPRASAKKYGAMTMKKLLEIANNLGCENRIALKAAYLPLAHTNPGGFYHKMGFSPGPAETRIIRKMEEEYLQMEAELLKKGISKDEAEQILHKQGYILPPCPDGRYLIEEGFMVLTKPECIVNYPV